MTCWGLNGSAAAPAAILLTGLLATLLTASPAARACTMAQVADVPLTLFENKLFVPVTVNGTAQRLAIDTGADVTVLSTAVARRLGIEHDFDHTVELMGVGGRDNHLYSGLVEHLDLGGIRLDGRHLAIADFSMPMADGEPSGGLLGGDLLASYDIDLDVPARHAGFWRVTGCDSVVPPWNTAVSAVPLTRRSSHLETLDVRVNEATVQLILDTGAPFLVLSERDAARAGVPPEMIENGRLVQDRGVNDTPFSGYIHFFNDVRVGDARYQEVPTVVVPRSRYGMDIGLLGLMFLRQHRVWLSYATNTLFVQTAPAAP